MALKKLCGAIDTDIKWVRAHSDLTARAAEWDRASREDGLLLPDLLVDDADAVIKTVPGAAAPLTETLMAFVAESRLRAQVDQARRIAGEAQLDMQRGRYADALRRMREFGEARGYEALTWAPQLTAAASQALSTLGLPFDQFKAAASDGAKLGIVESADLIVTAADSTLTFRSSVDLSLREFVTFDRPIAAFDLAGESMNVLITFEDGAVFVWDAQSKQTGTHVITKPIITQVAKFTSGGSTVLTMELINHGRVWDTKTGQRIAHAEAGFTSFVDAYFDEVARRIVAMSGFGVLRQWREGETQEISRAGSDRSVKIRPWYQNPEVRAARFDPSGRFVFVEGYRPHAHALVPRSLYHLKRGADRHELEWLVDLPSEAVEGRAFTFSADGNYLALQRGDQSIAVVQTSDGTLAATVPSGLEYQQIALRSNGSVLVGLTAAGSIDVWRRDTLDPKGYQPVSLGQARATAGRRSVMRQGLWCQGGGVTSLDFSEDGQTLVAAFRNGSVGATSSKGCGRTVESGIDAVATHITISPGSEAALVCFGKGSLGVLDLSRYAWRFTRALGDAVQWCGAWLERGRAVVVVSGYSVVSVVDARNGERIATLDLRAGSLLAVVAMNETEFLVTSDTGQAFDVRLDGRSLNVSSRTVIADVALTSLAVSADGITCVGGCSDGAVVTWNRDEKVIERRLVISSHAITSVCIAAGDNRVAAATRGGEVGVFDPLDAKTLFWSVEHDRPVWSARFLTDGATLGLALEDGSIRLLDVSHTVALGRNYCAAFEQLSKSPDRASDNGLPPLATLPSFFSAWDGVPPGPSSRLISPSDFATPPDLDERPR
ncbi:MAG: WD40 repeat domain-containing protein [Pseudomonadota bacterium]